MKKKWVLGKVNYVLGKKKSLEEYRSYLADPPESQSHSSKQMPLGPTYKKSIKVSGKVSVRIK
jgi:hypothetical protein